MSAAPPPLRARYIGYVKDTENLGDEALIWIVRDMLAPEIEVRTDFQDYDIALLGGGTLINQSPWLIDAFASALDRAGHGVVLGTGVGDLAFWGDHFERWTPLLKRCRRVGVRGPDSLALLLGHGVKHARAIGDPFLWLRNPTPRMPVSRRLGVNLGSSNDSLFGSNDRDLHDFIAEALADLKGRGWTFVWVSVWEKDLPLLDRVRRIVDPSSPPVLDSRRHALEALSALAGCDVFLGEKLHAIAMAAVADVPFVALEYQPKVRDFTASLGMAECTVSTAARDPKALIGQIEDVRRQRAAIRRRMASARDALRRRMRRFVHDVKSDFAVQRDNSQNDSRGGGD